MTGPDKSNCVLSEQLSHFEALFSENADPWKVRESIAEQVKRRTVGLLIGFNRLADGLELGCGNGVSTRALAAHFARLIAIDGSPAAVDLTCKEVGTISHVEVRLAALPCQLPALAFDVIVANEILYYMPPREIQKTLKAISAALRPGGRFITANHLRIFHDTQCSNARLIALVRAVFGRERRCIWGPGWRCDLFVQPAIRPKGLAR